MAYGVFTFDVIVTLLLSGWLLFSYGDWMRHRLLVTLAVLVAWYFSFLIITVLPLDVSSTAYRQCVNATIEQHMQHINTSTTHVSRSNLTSNWSQHDKRLLDEVDGADIAIRSDHCTEPHTLMDPSTLPSLWRIVYWSSQFLTWLILPVMQSFTLAGEFTFGGKLKSSLWDNAIYYSSYLLIALILVIYIALQPGLHLTWERTKAIAAAASNTWGLFVLVLMLGYGLVEVPRTLWNRSQRGHQLTHSYFKVSKLMSEKSDAEETLEDVLLSVYLVSNEISGSDPRRTMVETILQKIPLDQMDKVKRRRENSHQQGTDQGASDITEKSLARLHRQVIAALQAFNRTEAQWSDWTEHVFELEDINRNMISNEHRFVRSTPPSHSGVMTSPFRNNLNSLTGLLCNPVVEWYWKCLVKPILLKVAAGLAVAMSALIIWSEVTFFSIRPTLSVFAAIVKAAADSHNYVVIESVSFITVFYLCLCTYFTIFKVRVLNYYYLAKNHHSDEYTLLFSGALLCRLTPPLCLNFLSIIHMDSHVIQSTIMETAYTQVMGHMDVVSIVSDYFNIYFPIALLALTLATYFSLGARFLSGLGFQQFLTQDSELTLDLVEEGKEHIKRERRRRQRMAESVSRKREFQTRFGSESAEPRASEVRQRAADIVKARGSNPNTISSPERGLLSEPPADQASINLFGQDHSQNATTHFRPEPPKNIFDDL